MNEVDGWSPELRRQAGALAAKRLRDAADEAHAIAMSLAPDGAGPGVRYGEYRTTLASPASFEAYQARFGALAALLPLVEQGVPGALELSLAILARLDPEATVEIAELLLPNQPWPGLGNAIGRALGACSSARSFDLLLAFPEVPYLRAGVAHHAYPGGVARAWELVRAAGELRELAPRTRDQILPVLWYLLAHDRDAALPHAIALADAGEPRAAHALAEHAEGRTILLDRLASAPPGKALDFAARLAVKLLLERDAKTAVDALGGEAFLASSDGRPRLGALLDGLRDDVWRAHGTWFTSDPRIARLCAGLADDRDPAMARLARDMLATLPRDKGGRPARARPAAAPRPQRAPSQALLRELTEIGTGLRGLKQHLLATGYRFVAPRRVVVPPSASDLAALARLEKRVVVPPVLAAVIRVIGSVDLRGQHPSWPRAACLSLPGSTEPVWLTDPLVLAPASRVIAAALEDTREPPFQLAFAPDAYGKAGFSGGVVTVWLPQAGDDPELDGSGETLLAHLRRAIAWAGFPGFAAIAERPEAWLAAARDASRPD